LTPPETYRRVTPTTPWVLVGNARVASNVCGAKKQGTKYFAI
jgi:hypothetical protein